MNKRTSPPKLALQFFRWYCHPGYLEDLEGDLVERFERNVEAEGTTSAQRKFTKDVIRLFRPGIIRSLNERQKPNDYDMLRHNLILNLRSFKRYKNSFFVNLTGLSTGLACFLLISLWVRDELGMDKFHANDPYLYQVMNNLHQETGITTSTSTPAPLGKALVEEVPGVKQAASVIPVGFFNEFGLISATGDNYIKAAEQYASEDYFNIFSYRLLEGNRSRALSTKEGVVISNELAQRLFNTTQGLVGKDIKWVKEDYSGDFVITGVFEKPPKNSSQQFDLVFSMEFFLEKEPYLKKWWNSDPRTYVLLEKEADPISVNESIENFIKTKLSKSASTLFLQRYSERYLNGRYENGLIAGGRIQYVQLFSATALLILVIACINFINLSTAKASRRMKEIGVKKTIGAGRGAIAWQFLGESFLMTLLALAVSLLMVAILLPYFNTIVGKQLTLHPDPWMILGITAATFFTSTLSGIYPAFYLSKFNAVHVLKGTVASRQGTGQLRKGLVVFQFAVSIILITSVIVMYQQVAYIQSKDLGYDRKNILYINNDGQLLEKKETFFAKLREISGVVNATTFFHDLVGDHGGTWGLSWEGKDPDATIRFGNLEVGYDFIETLSIEMAAGRSYSKDHQDGEGKIIFNEAAIATMGLKDPIGKKINLWGTEREIIGVVKNFHFESIHEEIKPCFLQLVNSANKTLIKIQEGTEKITISQIQTLHEEINPGFPFEYEYLEDDYRTLYAPEKQASVLSGYFCGMAILISCLGLFGLVAFIVERRLKEIGIRKILGSGTAGIIYLLSSDFTRMIVIAVLLALPASYFLVKNWLDGFAYRIALEWWFFFGAGFTTLVIAWLTVSVQTFKAAYVNPVECLRDE